ncbi:DUF6867 family protein [Bosea sp. ANAM02]|uniref:DUF6867 family protein n=1 Tax=Bosea sp. ANAM02 TaxID=2020412 RepID=UPI0006483FF8|nr:MULTISPECIES: hypothetical protein [Hyphomicrobiales]BCB19297.1 hypothetical protein OCUBac02_21910 [Bosea sp. ANAM02]
MQGILYEEPTIWLFLLVTVVMGGWLAWMAGRAIALTWRSQWQLVVYMLALGLFVRFIHFALFEATLLTVHYYIVDTIVLVAFGYAGWRYTRAKQMTRQYHWLFEPAGPFGWKPRAGAEIRPELL